MERKMLLTFHIVIVISGVILAGALPNTKIFYPTKVLSATLEGITGTEVLSSQSEVICALEAYRRPWAHLMCYEHNRCYLYDLVQPAYQEINTGEVLDICMTEYSRGCLLEGTIVKENVTYIEDCEIMQCHNSLMRPYDEVLGVPCGNNFTYVPNLGCLHIASNVMSYFSGDEYCSSLGASLLIITDPITLGSYLNCRQVAGQTFWVGVYDNKWIDGKDLVADEWGPNQPNNNFLSCGAIAGDMKVYDFQCTNAYIPICQKEKPV